MRSNNNLREYLNNENQQHDQIVNKQRKEDLKIIQIKKDLKKKFNLLLEFNLMEMKKEDKY